MTTTTDRIISIMVAMLFACSLTAAGYDRSGFCPITPGMELRYANYDADNRLRSYYVIKVAEAEGTLEKGRVVFDQTFFNADGSAMFDGNGIEMEVTVGGETTVSRMHDAAKVMRVQDLISKGDASSIPPELSVGTDIPDGIIEVKVGRMGSTIRTVDREITDHDSISVPAGTFDCWLIEEKQETRIIGTRTNTVKTWYAKGIGCVKQTVYDKKGNIENIQVLESVTFPSTGLE